MAKVMAKYHCQNKQETINIFVLIYLKAGKKNRKQSKVIWSRQLNPLIGWTWQRKEVMNLRVEFKEHAHQSRMLVRVHSKGGVPPRDVTQTS